MKSLKGKGIPTDMVCEKCGSPMSIKWGRNGRFIACTNYPDCKNTMNLPEAGNGSAEKNGEGVPELTCEKCGRPMVLKQGRFGKFMACSGYPECKTTVKITAAGSEPASPKEEVLTDKICEQCGKPLAIKSGRYGKFLGCTGYPACKVIHPLHLDIPCPEPSCNGFLSERRSKTGKIFYGCTCYPECKFVTWSRPLPEACPLCNAPFLVEKRTKTGSYKQCHRKECKYRSDLVVHAP